MTAPEPTPTEHIDAVAFVIESAWSDGDDATIAHAILTSTDPAMHAAMLDALVRAGVLTPEDAPIARHGGYEHTHWQQRWDGQHTHEGRRFVTPWEVAP